MAAGGGDDAVGAVFVAAADDADEGLEFGAVRGVGADEVVGDGGGWGVFEGMLLAAGFDGGFEEGGELMELGWAAEEVDLFHAVEERFAVAFGHAAQDADDEVGILFFAGFEFAYSRPDFLFGFVADGAGVVEDDVGGFDVGGEVVAVGAELGFDEFGVEDVHLAAEGFDVDFFHGIVV